MVAQKKRHKRTNLTLSGLEEIYFEKGFSAAKAAFERFSGPRKDWAVVKEGIPSRRTDLTHNSGIEYGDYSGPALWQPPYAVLRASLASEAKEEEFVSHSGEEIVVPIKGKTRFHFFWSKGEEKPKVFNCEIKPGEILRLNPDVPHFAWGNGSNAEAWVIIRDASNSEAAVSTAKWSESTTSDALHRSPTSSTDKTKLKNPGRYSLTAWGLASKLKSYRERAELTIRKVSENCGINHTHLSRIESGDTNISVETLLKLADFLSVDIGEFFSASPWCTNKESIPPSLDDNVRHAFKAATCKHYLHTATWRIAAEKTTKLGVNHEKQQGTMSTFITLSGQAIADCDGAPELLYEGTVMHLRAGKVMEVRALKDCLFFEVCFSSICNCSEAT